MSALPPGMGHRFASSKVLYPYPTGMTEAVGPQEHSKAVHAPAPRIRENPATAALGSP